VWCHHALTIEAVLDRTDSATLVSTHRQRTAPPARHLPPVWRRLSPSEVAQFGRPG
jgi:hypothetical protein